MQEPAALAEGARAYASEGGEGTPGGAAEPGTAARNLFFENLPLLNTVRATRGITPGPASQCLGSAKPAPNRTGFVDSSESNQKNC